MNNYDFLGSYDFDANDVAEFIDIAEKNNISKRLLFNSMLNSINNGETDINLEFHKISHKGKVRIYDIDEPEVTYRKVIKKYYDDVFFAALRSTRKVNDPNARKGFVYILEAGNKIKIGKTKNVQQRISAIQSMCSDEIKLVQSFKSDNYSKLESELHQAFADNRCHGEWFDASIKDKALALSKKLLSGV